MWRMIILSFAMWRVIKCNLRSRLRENLWSNTTSDCTDKRLIADIFNSIFEQWKPTTSYMNPNTEKHTRLLLLEKFPGILTDEEKEMPASEFQKLFSSRMVLSLLLQLKLVKFSEKISKYIPTVTDLSAFHLVEGDITEVCAAIKGSVAVDLGFSIAYQHMGKDKMKSNMKLIIKEEILPHIPERILLWRLTRIPVGHNIQLTGEEGVHVNPFCGPLVERSLRQVCGDAKNKNIDTSIWAFLKEEYFIIQDVEPETDPAILSQARRLLKQAVEYHGIAQVSSAACVHPMTMWGDVFKDIAETYSDWKKKDKYYEMAYDKFRFAATLAGPTVPLLFIWMITLRRHAAAALRFNFTDRANALIQSADDKLADIDAIYQFLISRIHEGKRESTSI